MKVHELITLLQQQPKDNVVFVSHNPDEEGGFRYDDPEIGIAWPVEKPILSERDRSAPYLRELREKVI